MQTELFLKFMRKNDKINVLLNITIYDEWF